MTSSTPTQALQLSDLPPLDVGIDSDVPVTIMAQGYEPQYAFGALQGLASFGVHNDGVLGQVANLVIVAKYQGEQYLLGYMHVDMTGQPTSGVEQLTLGFTLRGNSAIPGDE